MKITSLDINNFRCIKSAKFDFHNRLNVFIGENGAGKSTVLNCFAFTAYMAYYFQKHQWQSFY